MFTKIAKNFFDWHFCEVQLVQTSTHATKMFAKYFFMISASHQNLAERSTIRQKSSVSPQTDLGVRNPAEMLSPTPQRLGPNGASWLTNKRNKSSKHVDDDVKTPDMSCAHGPHIWGAKVCPERFSDQEKIDIFDQNVSETENCKIQSCKAIEPKKSLNYSTVMHLTTKKTSNYNCALKHMVPRQQIVLRSDLYGIV